MNIETGELEIGDKVYTNKSKGIIVRIQPRKDGKNILTIEVDGGGINRILDDKDDVQYAYSDTQLSFLKSLGYISGDELKDLKQRYTTIDVLLDSEDLETFKKIK